MITDGLGEGDGLPRAAKTTGELQAIPWLLLPSEVFIGRKKRKTSDGRKENVKRRKTAGRRGGGKGAL